MTGLITIQYLTTLAYAVTALVLVLFVLRWLDKSAGHPWKIIGEKIRRDPLATALYYGARFIGACLLVGMLLSR